MTFVAPAKQSGTRPLEKDYVFSCRVAGKGNSPFPLEVPSLPETIEKKPDHWPGFPLLPHFIIAARYYY